jgi:hypothetical protein
MDVHAKASCRGREAPDDCVVADDRAGRVVGGTEDRMRAAPGEVEHGADLLHFARAEEDRVDAVLTVQEGTLALEAERRLGMGEPEQSSGRVEQVEVELAPQVGVEPMARPVERDRLGSLVVRPYDRRVSPGPAGADVAALEDGHVRDAVVLGEVVGGREPMAASTDDDHVVAPPRLACG